MSIDEIGFLESRPLVLIDLDTRGGPNGHAHLAPYRPEAALPRSERTPALDPDP